MDDEDGEEAWTADERPFHATWDPADPESVTGAVVEAVAATREGGPLDIVDPLDEAVDADALTRLLASGAGRGQVSVDFRYANRSVTVRDDGDIVVAPAE
ncbi:MAG: HalOD1 output domain-containing protein [Halorientalis sp.]